MTNFPDYMPKWTDSLNIDGIDYEVFVQDEVIDSLTETLLPDGRRAWTMARTKALTDLAKRNEYQEAMKSLYEFPCVSAVEINFTQR